VSGVRGRAFHAVSAALPRRHWVVPLAYVLALMTAAPASAQQFSGFAQDVLNLVNVERARIGLTPLVRATELDSAAQQHSQSMADNGFFSHTGLDGSSPFERMRRAGYAFVDAGENIAVGFATPQAVMEAWMNSTGHRANILQPYFSEIGIGIAARSGTTGPIYWTQDFGARLGGPPSMTTPPALSGITPAAGPVASLVTLTGRGLGSSGTVTFTLGRLARVLSWSDTRIEAEVPDGAVSGDVSLKTASGVSNGVRFAVVPATTPSSGSSGAISPTNETIRPHIDAIATNTIGIITNAIIIGQNLGWFGDQVTFNGVLAVIVSSWTPERIEVMVPFNATSGPVVVTTDQGSSDGFPFNVPGKPPL
jgi:uncharacterized protein YkwD